MVLKQTVGRFLKQHHTTDAPLLLALSGGPDSLALYHALLEWKVEFAVAHIDHGWRSTSAQEAAALQSSCRVPFHLLTLDPSTIEGNLEDECRNKRLHFFKSLVEKYGYRAVLMGHHADDQAETVLKRLFEGASFTQLGGMEETSFYEGMRIWRPFLPIPKRSILAYCAEKKLQPINDCTNLDERYLRAKMRKTLMPSLCDTFGKEIVKPLARISTQALELKEYLDKKSESIFERRVTTPDGWSLNLNDVAHSVEIKHFLKQFLLSQNEIDIATTLILQKKADKWVGPLYIHQGCVFYKVANAPNTCDDISDLIREEYKLTVDDE